MCPRDGGINVYSVSGEGASLLHSATSSELSLAGRIAKISLAGTVCVLADFADAMVCFDLETNTLACQQAAWLYHGYNGVHGDQFRW